MILVPGVPLINGILDMIRNHVTIGLSRLGFAALVVLAIALGVFAAARLTSVGVPVDSPTLTVGVPQDALFSALAAGGYALLFNVPARMAWACGVCGVASHTLRTLLFHFGLDLITGTLIGALVVGFLAQGFARHFRAPAVALAFPGVVAMVPGAYAFRAVFGTLQIAEGTDRDCQRNTFVVGDRRIDGGSDRGWRRRARLAGSGAVVGPDRGSTARQLRTECETAEKPSRPWRVAQRSRLVLARSISSSPRPSSPHAAPTG